MPRQIARAEVQAINRTATTLKKEAGNLVAAKVQPQRKRDTGDAITIKRATRVSRQATITLNERHLPLDKVKGVRVVSFLKGRRRVQRVTYRGRILDGAFRPKNLVRGDKAIFAQSRGRYSTGTRRVKRLYAYSLLQEVDRDRLLRKLEPVARRRFSIELARALSFYLRQT